MSMAFATLSMPPMEEAMEMSSPAAGQQVDDDIDIDFDDDYAVGDQTNDDEHMLEDGDPVRPGTAATDDLMADVDHTNVTSVPTIVEEEMQDSDGAAQPEEQHMNDEELIDYEDEIYPDQPQEASVGTAGSQFPEKAQTFTDAPAASTAESSLLTPAKSPTAHDQVDEEIVRGPEGASVRELSEPQVATAMATAPSVTTAVAEQPADEPPAYEQMNAETARHFSEAISQQPSDEAVAQTVTEAPALASEKLVAVEDAENSATVTKHVYKPNTEDGPEQEVNELVPKLSPHHPGTVDVSASFVTDGPPTPTDRTLHAMSIQFGDYRWPLFKSQSQPDGLLKDDNLLNVSLTDLLHSLRERLALKVNNEDMITEARDLVLNFDIFGLMVAESSLHASATSLADVLGVYLDLQGNDGVPEHDTPPLFMTLTTQLNFSNSIASLKQLAENGAGLPSIVDNENHHDTAENYHEEVADEEDWTECSAHEEVDLASDSQEQNSTESYAEEDLTGRKYQCHEENEFHIHDIDAGEHQYAQSHTSGKEELSEILPPTNSPLDGWGFHDEVPHEEVPHEEVPHEEVPHEEVPHEEVPHEEVDVPHEEVPHEEVPHEDVPHKEIPEKAEPDTLAVRTEEFIETHSDASSSVIVANAANNSSELHESGRKDDLSALLVEDQFSIPEESADVHATVDEYGNDAESEYDESGLNLGNSNLLDEDYPQDGNDALEDQHDSVEAGQERSTSGDGVDSSVLYDRSQADQTDLVGDDEPPDTESFDTAFDLLDDDGKEPFDEIHEVADADYQAPGPEHDEDDIGFDLDEDEPALVSLGTFSPRHVKRSLGDAADDDDQIDFDEPELKKARAD